MKPKTTRAAEGNTAGSLRIQVPEEMYMTWEECVRLCADAETELPLKDEIPRHLRAMVNCALFQRSLENDFSIVTDNEELCSFAGFWDIRCMSVNEMESASSKALDKYNQDMKAYQARQRTAARSNPGKQRTLWNPPK